MQEIIILGTVGPSKIGQGGGNIGHFVDFGIFNPELDRLWIFEFWKNDSVPKYLGHDHILLQISKSHRKVSKISNEKSGRIYPVFQKK